ncbi:hypothetical protein [Chelativorans salis]|uniref:Uncharacterized protein n=1 Tax=Chelativorans salis TaxID=2978478 RepID=A0ABT2LVX2_9HYPH|nr:hypothetical protein [Chelativorans sp. EGI FJ00035]MCT7378685.1 hypothetical protein [Chelativorans sp. EGI FJ00035]
MQLRGTPVQGSDPNAMPLADYISETVALIEEQPGAEEVLVERVHFQRFAEREGRYAESFARLNG